MYKIVLTAEQWAAIAAVCPAVHQHIQEQQPQLAVILEAQAAEADVGAETKKSEG